MRYFNQLGARVDECWKKWNYEEKFFPDVASMVLCENKPSDAVTVDEIVEWAVTTAEMPAQNDLAEMFGQPPLTVYQGREFRIEVLFWIDGVPEIHQHSFSGAFHVLAGSSLHVEWRFDKAFDYGVRLATGRMTLRERELLVTGDTRAIGAGDTLIHSTFHLDCPTVSVVVRTIGEPQALPQYAYMSPGIAHAHFHEIPIVKRRTQVFKMLLKSGQKSRCLTTVERLTESDDAYALFQYLRAIHMHLDPDTELAPLLVRVGKRFPDLGDSLALALAAVSRADKIKSMRRSTKGGDVQFLLALLLNVFDRHSMLELFRARYPDIPPVQQFLDALKKLSNDAQFGVSLSDTGIFLAGQLVEGRNFDEIKEAFVEFRPKYRSMDIDDMLNQSIKEVKMHWLLKPVLEN